MSVGYGLHSSLDRRRGDYRRLVDKPMPSVATSLEMVCTTYPKNSCPDSRFLGLSHLASLTTRLNVSSEKGADLQCKRKGRACSAM